MSKNIYVYIYVYKQARKVIYQAFSQCLCSFALENIKTRLERQWQQRHFAAKYLVLHGAVAMEVALLMKGRNNGRSKRRRSEKMYIKM